MVAVAVRRAFSGQVDLTGPIAPRTSMPHVFSIPAKDWEWMLGWPTYAASANPHFKYFNYTAYVRMVDVFGNSYKEIPSPGVEIEVKVDSKKERYASAAAASALAAASLAASALVATASIFGIPAAAGLAAAATLAWGAAASAAKNAHDPPAPDPAFLDRVDVVVPRTDTIAGVDPSLPSERLWREVLHVMAADEALTFVHGKLLGASQADSAEGRQMQTLRYLEIINEMKQSLAAAQGAADETEAAYAKSGLFTAERVQQALEATRSGVPEAMLESLRSVGLSDNDIGRFGECLRDEELRRRLMETDASAATRAMLLQLEGVVREVENESIEILR
jgi:hypothetical protein